MRGGIFSLAFQGVRRKKKSSVLIFMVLLLSFSFAIASLSLLGSMTKTNAEFRLNTYGEWLFGIPTGTEKDAEWLKEQDWVENVGTSKSYGTVVGANRLTGFGTVDEKLKEVGRLKINEGTWPVNDNEIAMEADTLGLLGYDYTLGQEITLQISVQDEITEQKFILCGIIREYTDLWLPNMNRSGQMLNGAVVIEEAANQVLGVDEDRKPVLQYFISAKEANWESGREALRKYMATPDRRKTDNFVYENNIAYIVDSSITAEKAEAVKAEIAKAEGRFYIYAIAAVALLAVICIYIMQLPAEIHSFAILRSIGITKGQMAKLLFMESLLLGVPAMILGIPLGMGLTWFALKLTMYSGSVPVQVEIPFEMMRFLILLWIVMILLSRLIVLCVTVRTPLTGKMRGGKNRAKRIRSSFIILLMAIFGAVTIFTSVKLLTPKASMEQWSSYATYKVFVNYRSTEIDNNPCVVEPLLELIEQVPGITNAVGASEIPIAICFDGMEMDHFSYEDFHTLIWMYAIDSDDWDDTFVFGADKEAFDRGELVLLCFPDNESGAFAANADFILPEGEIQVMGYEDALDIDYGTGLIVTPKPDLCVISAPTPVSIQYIPYDASRSLIIDAPYTVICSNAYVEKLTTLLKPRELGESRYEPQWDSFSGDREVGYEEVYVYADRNAEDLSTDKVLAQLCRSNYLGMDNRRQEYMAHIQENLQKLILLCSSGICIALMALLICYGALSLETEQEKRYFRTMRIIGMSSKQMMGRVIGKALFRSCIAVLSGWLFYFCYAVVRMVQSEQSIGEAVRNVVPDLFLHLKFVQTDVTYLGILTILCLIIPFILSLLAKCKLRKENMLS